MLELVANRSIIRSSDPVLSRPSRWYMLIEVLKGNRSRVENIE